MKTETGNKKMEIETRDAIVMPGGMMSMRFAATIQASLCFEQTTAQDIPTRRDTMASKTSSVPWI